MSHQGDGQLLDPLPTLVHMDNGEIVAPAPKVVAAPLATPRVFQYVCEPRTCERNMEAYELMQIVSMALGGISITLDRTQFMALSADVRRHFRPVAVVVKDAA